MEERRLYETDEEVAQRVEILQHLLELVKKWTKKVAEHESQSDIKECKHMRPYLRDAMKEPRGLVFSYGSFGLHTQSPGMLPFTRQHFCLCAASNYL